MSYRKSPNETPISNRNGKFVDVFMIKILERDILEMKIKSNIYNDRHLEKELRLIHLPGYYHNLKLQRTPLQY
jgi:glutamate/tyrosine decarboxylase-like PLP-dependent enzyme